MVAMDMFQWPILGHQSNQDEDQLSKSTQTENIKFTPTISVAILLSTSIPAIIEVRNYPQVNKLHLHLISWIVQWRIHEHMQMKSPNLLNQKKCPVNANKLVIPSFGFWWRYFKFSVLIHLLLQWKMYRTK